MRHLTEVRKFKGQAHILTLPDWTTFDPEVAKAEAKQICAEGRGLVEITACNKVTFESFIAIEEITDRLQHVVGPLDNLYAAMQTPIIEEAYREVARLQSEYVSDLFAHEGLYFAFAQYRRTQEYRDLGEEAQCAIDLFWSKFKSSGINFTPKNKVILRNYEREMEDLSRRFERNIVESYKVPACVITEPDKSRLDGLPSGVIDVMRSEAQARGIDGWVALPKDALRLPILSSAKDRELRKAVYRAHVTSASDIGALPDADNRPILERMLLLRHKEAQLFGDNNYAKYSRDKSMAGSPSAILDFLSELRKYVLPLAQKEIAELGEFVQGEFGHELAPWDIEYAKECLLRKRFGYTGEDLAAYLTLDEALLGLFRLARRLYGVRIVERKNVPIWHPDVRFFEVFEHRGSLAGGFYLDPYARIGALGKQASLWTQNILYRRKLTSAIKLPLVAIHLNLPDSGTEKGKSFSHKEMIGLFHECGHMLHFVLGRSSFLETSPDAVEDDAIEIPSMLMENWCWDTAVLRGVMKRAKKEKPIPPKLLRAIKASRYTLATVGRWSPLEYLTRSFADMYLHAAYPRKGFVDSVNARLAIELPAMPVDPSNRFPNNFDYIFGGGYETCFYGYLWAERISADTYLKHQESARSVSSIVGRLFRREVLEASRSRPMRESYIAFRGHIPSTWAMLTLRHVVV